jgi:hypothetical protein
MKKSDRLQLAGQNMAEDLFAEISFVHGALKDKLLPQIYKLGFL